MADQIYIGKFAKGLKTNPAPFNIDNGAFPYIFNMYVWRGRAKRKRGTQALARLQAQIDSLPFGIPLPWQFGAITFANGVVNLLTFSGAPASASITPGSLNIGFQGQFYTEPTPPNGNVVGSGGGTGSVNYATGALTINGFGATGNLQGSGTFSYFPGLPVLGLEDLVSNTGNSKFPLLMAFDNLDSYQINQTSIPFFYLTSYYKGTNIPFTWSADDSNQFWSTNYQSAFWVTNNKPGFHFKLLTNTLAGATSILQISPTRVSVGLTGHGIPLIAVGDYLWFNEVTGTIATGTGSTQNQNINGMTGIVTLVVDANTLQVDFTGANGTSVANFQGGATGQNGIAQYLTRSVVAIGPVIQDGIKWYDGDPTSGTGLPTGTGLGWVNFAPPLTALVTSINDQVADKYYLVGALAILPFKDRLLFFGPQIQTSTGPVIQKPLQDTVLWSWNGTPYYTALVPTNSTGTETFDPTAYYVDQTGKGGYQPAGIAQPIVTVLTNEDVLLIGFGGAGKKTRFVYTGNDLQPFLFYLINSEMPSCSTFSGISLDKGGIDIGQYGITITTQQEVSRIDMDIPDAVFTIQANNNGQNRVNAIRDFQREWIYFSYPTGNGVASGGSWKYPSQSFLYNYRDDTWSVLRENYTHHGTYRAATGKTWLTLGFKSWAVWREPWNAGSSQALFPSIIAGTPQGYVVIKSEGTGESPTGFIQSIINDGSGNTQIVSINHCVNSGDTGTGGLGDYLSFGGTSIGVVIKTIDANNFVIDIPFPSTATITGATQANPAVLTLTWASPPDAPTISSFFPGQTVSIAGVVGMTQLNGNTYSIRSVTPTSITLNVDSTGFTAYISGGVVTLVGFIGLSVFTKLSQPIIQSKMFPFYWEQGRQVRLGVQRYLMDTTANGQVTVDISLSQDPENDWNDSPIVPAEDVTNDSLLYSQILFTCPETINSGLTALTPANTSLQNLIGSASQQIWHRMNTSLQGDTFQVGITLSDVQMRNLEYATSEVVLHGIQLTVFPGPMLS